MDGLAVLRPLVRELGLLDLWNGLLNYHGDHRHDRIARGVKVLKRNRLQLRMAIGRRTGRCLEALVPVKVGIPHGPQHEIKRHRLVGIDRIFSSFISLFGGPTRRKHISWRAAARASRVAPRVVTGLEPTVTH